jgi:ubiquitin-like 1-activating enzyme E1 B
MLHGTLKYGEEISLLVEGGKLIYDVDFDDLLDRPVGEIGLYDGRTLTVVDEETDRVNVEFIISEGKEFIFPAVPPIPTKPANAQLNGVENGEEASGKKRAREEDHDDSEFRKRARVAEEKDLILIDEDDDMIMIDM